MIQKLFFELESPYEGLERQGRRPGGEQEEKIDVMLTLISAEGVNSGFLLLEILQFDPPKIEISI